MFLLMLVLLQMLLLLLRLVLVRLLWLMLFIIMQSVGKGVAMSAAVAISPGAAVHECLVQF